MDREKIVKVDRELELELSECDFYVGKKSIEDIRKEILTSSPGIFYLCDRNSELFLYTKELDAKNESTLLSKPILKDYVSGNFYVELDPMLFSSVEELIKYNQYLVRREVIDGQVVNNSYLRRPYVEQSAPFVKDKYQYGEVWLVYGKSESTSCRSSSLPVKGDFAFVEDPKGETCDVIVLALDEVVTVFYSALETFDDQPYYGGHLSAKEAELLLFGAASGSFLVRKGFSDGRTAFYAEIKLDQTVATLKASHNENGGDAQLKIETSIAGATAKDITFRTLNGFAHYVMHSLSILVGRNACSFSSGFKILPKDADALRKLYLGKTCSIIRIVHNSGLENPLQCKLGDTVVVRKIAAEGFFVESLSEASPDLKCGTVPFDCVRSVDTEDWYHGEETGQEPALQGLKNGTFFVTEIVDSGPDAVKSYILRVKIRVGGFHKVHIYNEKGTFILIGRKSLQSASAGSTYPTLHEVIRQGQANGFHLSEYGIVQLGDPLVQTSVQSEGPIVLKHSKRPRKEGTTKEAKAEEKQKKEETTKEAKEKEGERKEAQMKS